jgi:hypothetical protein
MKMSHKDLFSSIAHLNCEGFGKDKSKIKIFKFSWSW